MISSPCSAASRLYFSVSSTCPGGGSTSCGAGWPIRWWKTSRPAGIAIWSRWHSVSKRRRWGMSRGSQRKAPGSAVTLSSPQGPALVLFVMDGEGRLAGRAFEIDQAERAAGTVSAGFDGHEHLEVPDGIAAFGAQGEELVGH